MFRLSDYPYDAVRSGSCLPQNFMNNGRCLQLAGQRIGILIISSQRKPELRNIDGMKGRNPLNLLKIKNKFHHILTSVIHFRAGFGNQIGGHKLFGFQRIQVDKFRDFLNLFPGRRRSFPVNQLIHCGSVQFTVPGQCADIYISGLYKKRQQI